MRTILIPMFTSVILGTLQAKSPLRLQIYAHGEPVESKEFSVWTEKDPTIYQGTYFGDVAGDAGGELTIWVTKSENPQSPYLISGYYKFMQTGDKPVFTRFEDAAYGTDGEGVVNAKGIRLVFTKRGDKQGVLVGNDFIKKELLTEVPSSSPEWNAAIEAMQGPVSKRAGTPVTFKGNLTVCGKWAKFEGNTHADQPEKLSEHMEGAFSVDYLAVLEKVNGKWETRFFDWAGDIGAHIDARKQLPAMPSALIPLPLKLMEAESRK